MGRLGHRDVRALSRFLLGLYAATDLDAFAGAVVRGLREVIPADRCSFNRLDPVTRQVSWVAAGAEEPKDPSLKKAVVTNMRRHPIAVHVRRTGDRRCLRLSDHTTRASFHRSPLYNEWYRHIGIEHQLIALFGTDDGQMVGPALSRDSRRDFTDRDRLMGNVLVPHLVNGYQVATRASRLQQEIVFLNQGLESTNAGVILLTDDSRMRLATTKARRRLAEYFGEAPRHPSRLPGPLRDWVVGFARARIDAEAVAQSWAPFVVKGDGGQLVADLVGEPPHRMLLLSEEFTGIPVRMLEPLGLTPREAEVLRWVAEGKRDGEIAMILGVSPRTIHHHLERVYRKLGVETRTAAAARAREVVTTRARLDTRS